MVDGDEIKDCNNNLIGKANRNDIKDRNYNRLGTLDDARKEIEGPGGTTIAALWLLFVR